MKQLQRAILTATCLTGLLMAQAQAQSTTDDVKWINECVADNKDAKVDADVVLKYCTCMNNKMDSSEARSISQWEKTHETERKECDKEAGWR